MRLTNIENNSYAKLLYNKPELESNSLIGRIKFFFKKRNYKSSVFDQYILYMRKQYPSFFEMCEFSDFIRILEKTRFYYNNIKSPAELKRNTRLLSDSPIDGSGNKKIIIMLLEKERISVTFEMTKVEKTSSMYIETHDIITINIRYEGNGSKNLCINFKITDGEVEHDSMHDWVMQKYIQDLLREEMINILIDYYQLF